MTPRIRCDRRENTTYCDGLELGTHCRGSPCPVLFLNDTHLTGIPSLLEQVRLRKEI